MFQISLINDISNRKNTKIRWYHCGRTSSRYSSEIFARIGLHPLKYLKHKIAALLSDQHQIWLNASKTFNTFQKKRESIIWWHGWSERRLRASRMFFFFYNFCKFYWMRPIPNIGPALIVSLKNPKYQIAADLICKFDQNTLNRVI